MFKLVLSEFWANFRISSEDLVLSEVWILCEFEV